MYKNTDFDYQQRKVYNWENQYIHPRDKSRIPFEQVQGIVNWIWEQEGYKYPPEVRAMPRQNKTAVASANRLSILVRESVSTSVLLHELAHSMMESVDGRQGLRGGAHGPLFMGMYIKLLNKYLKSDMVELLYTCRKHGVEFDLSATATFLD